MSCAEFYVTDSDGPLTDPKKIKTIEKVSRLARHTHRDLQLRNLISKLRDFCRCSTSIWKLMKPCLARQVCPTAKLQRI